MSKPRALVELLTAADAGLVAVDVDVNSANFAARRRASHGRRQRRAPVPAPALETPPTSSPDASFEFSAVVSYSSASPASVVFSDGQLRAHKFPAVASPLRSSSSMSMGSTKAASTGRKKRVSFAAEKRNINIGNAQKRKGGGLMGCMGSACGLSGNEVEEPAKNANRKVLAI